MVIETKEFTIAESKDEAYWIERKKVSEQQVKAHQSELEVIPQHIKFHKAIIKMCEEKLVKTPKTLK